MQDTHLSDLKFSSLNLHPKLLKGVEDAGFEYCTPIQALALPLALEGQDVAGQAQTGTGKTAAFLLATMQKLLLEDEKLAAEAEAGAAQDQAEASDQAETADAADEASADTVAESEAEPRQKPAKSAGEKDLKAIRSLILAPTRELAIQIHKDAEILVRNTDLKLGLAYGGTGYEQQRTVIENGVDILIGTPGRVIDYFKQGVFHLKNIRVAVMDECDRMFDLGFVADIRYLLRRMPPSKDRLNLLFSATLSYRVDELAYEHMNAPKTVKVESEMVVQRIEELAYYPAQDEKISLLINLLKRGERDRALIFINTKHEAAKIFDWLEANGLKAAILSGDVPQDRREKLLKRFHDGKVDILVATDVAARGLHIPDVSHVYNYDLPQDPEDYVHRSGRTARAGASGHAISFACEKYAYSMMDIEQYIGHAIPVQPIDPELLVKPENKPAFRERKPRDSRGRDGRRGDSRGRDDRGGRDSRGRGRGDRPEARKPQPEHQEEKRQQERPERQANQDRRERDIDEYYDDSTPLATPPVKPEDVKDSKFVPPPAKHSIRFGEIPAIG